jgi:hypothetical protein
MRRVGESIAEEKFLCWANALTQRLTPIMFVGQLPSPVVLSIAPCRL